MQLKCRIIPHPDIPHWLILAHPDDDFIAWSGSRWVNIHATVQVCNFNDRGAAADYCDAHCLEVIIE
jgi:hypothetical protein